MRRGPVIRAAAPAFVAILIVAMFVGYAKYDGDKAEFCRLLPEAPSFKSLMLTTSTGTDKDAAQTMRDTAIAMLSYAQKDCGIENLDTTLGLNGYGPIDDYSPFGTGFNGGGGFGPPGSQPEGRKRPRPCRAERPSRIDRRAPDVGELTLMRPAVFMPAPRHWDDRPWRRGADRRKLLTWAQTLADTRCAVGRCVVLVGLIVVAAACSSNEVRSSPDTSGPSRTTSPTTARRSQRPSTSVGSPTTVGPSTLRPGTTCHGRLPRARRSPARNVARRRRGGGLARSDDPARGGAHLRRGLRRRPCG